MASHEGRGEYAAAAADARWLVDHGFEAAPESERSAEAEAARSLDLARLAAKAGNVPVAVEALRDALAADPHQAAAVRAELAALPVGPAERSRLNQEFAWNIAALAPAGSGALPDEPAAARCWSYRVREIRIRRSITVGGPTQKERQVTYDARSWRFDSASSMWSPESDWVEDAGAEIELANGPEQPRYRAIVAAPHQFIALEDVPPCHRAGWRGPYETNGTVFTAAELPGTSPAGSKNRSR